MVKRDKSDRRTSPRIRFDIAGIVIRGDGEPPLDCLVSDLSEAGANVQCDELADLPDTFRLDLPHESVLFNCQVIWGSKGEVGVRFCPAPAV